MSVAESAGSVSIYDGEFASAQNYTKNAYYSSSPPALGHTHIKSKDYTENNHSLSPEHGTKSGSRKVRSKRYIENNKTGNFYRGLSIAGLCLLMAVISCAFAFHGYFTSPTINVGRESHAESKERLIARTVIGALHDSGERFDPPRCHKETRVAVLEEIQKWAKQPHLPSFYQRLLTPLLFSTVPLSPVLWLRGSAGTGKSAIAQTLAETWHREGRLAAAFFFSRSVPRRNENTEVVATIVYQLLRHFPSEIGACVYETIDTDSLIFDKSIQAQAEALIWKPLKTQYDHSSMATDVKVIVIDGLDEIMKPEEQTELLTILTSIIIRRTLPLRLLIASRPEPQILSAFNLPELFDATWSFDLNERQDIDHDIEAFLRSRFSSIRREFPWLKKASWPPDDVIPTLVERAAGTFIYATTVMDYIVSDQDQTPEEMLKIVLGLQFESKVGSAYNPFAALDAMYTQILSSLPNSTLGIAKDTLSYILNIQQCPHTTGWACCSCGMHGECSPWFYWEHPIAYSLHKLLAIDELELAWHLKKLHSVISISDGGHVLLAKHKSFLDFMTDPSRAGQFYLDNGHANARVSLLYLKHLFERLTLSPGQLFAPPSDAWKPAWQGGEPGWMPGNLMCSLTLASPYAELERAISAVVQPEEEPYFDYLKSVNLVLERRRNLEVIPVSGRREMIHYLSKCNDQSDRTFLQKLLTKFNLRQLLRLAEEDDRLIQKQLLEMGYWWRSDRLELFPTLAPLLVPENPETDRE